MFLPVNESYKFDLIAIERQPEPHQDLIMRYDPENKVFETYKQNATDFDECEGEEVKHELQEVA